MPFGLVFGALFFGVLCSGFGLGLFGGPAGPARLAGASVVLLGPSLAIGLWQRRGWARWAGVLGAAVVAGLASLTAGTGARRIDIVTLLSALIAAVLLLWPATGDPRREAAGATPARGAGRLPGLAVAVAFTGLAAAAVWSQVAPSGAAVPSSVALPASSIARSVRWSDFGSALDRARAESTPILVTFVTSWCPYCTKMRDTWRDGRVVARLQDLPAVRLDAEDTRAIDGHSGAELARRFEVVGYPAQILLDDQGRTLARVDGYQSADQLVAWLDSALGPAPRSAPTAALEAGRQ